MTQPLDALLFRGSGLTRPECVLAHASGHLLAADWGGNGGVSLIRPDGTTAFLHARAPAPWGEPWRPNGVALAPDGRVLFAHLGATTGGLFALLPDGSVEPVVTEIGGRPLPPSNFVFCERDGACWLTVSTRRVPRADAWRADVADGFIVRLDRRGARIAADGLGYANEAVPSPDGEWLLVNETFARRTRAFRLQPDGSLGEARTIATYGPGIFPDGLAFDREGGAWITSIVSNTVLRVGPDGATEVVLSDADTGHVAEAEAAWREARMQRRHLDTIASRVLRNVSSLAFGGPDLRTAWLGCLLGETIAGFRAPVAGHPPPHWSTDITALITAPALSAGPSEGP